MLELDTKFHPELLAADAWIAANATVVGDVKLAARSSVWFGAVVRGDCDSIEIGQETNIQDLCCIHVDPGYPCVIGNRVTVGHAAIVHGASIQDGCLIGIRAVIMNGAKIGENSIIGAGAIVTEGKTIPPRSLVIGTPGRVVRDISDEDIERLARGTAHYVSAAAAFREAGGIG